MRTPAPLLHTRQEVKAAFQSMIEFWAQWTEHEADPDIHAKASAVKIDNPWRQVRDVGFVIKLQDLKVAQDHEGKMMENTQEVPLMTKMTGVPEDFISHQASWRAALEHCIKTAPEATHDMDDKGYWQHELAAFDRAYVELNAMPVVDEGFLQRPVTGMNGLTIEGALGADWSAVHGSLVQARNHLQKDGVRHTWLDGAIAIAESRARSPIPEAYLRREAVEIVEGIALQVADEVKEDAPDSAPAPAP